LTSTFKFYQNTKELGQAKICLSKGRWVGW